MWTQVVPRFKVGDRVLVARKIPHGDPRDVAYCGWYGPDKDATVGKSGTVDRISDRGNVWVAVDGEKTRLYPDAALESALFGNEED